ncbi:hypothetical protein QJS04_geneDACA016228 [Acorus gramineus]|uniref:Reverse transcriptase domain-containing protein n=1 Tax=Acorus gramineus TaxID=55184 RepID=A0AAV9AGE7_ACOGR|nr:hypothetical protein QJS04_geneDACA016228 [Acorus gramineus]
MTASWCVGGNFNEVRFGYEKVGGSPIHSRQSIPAVPSDPRPFRYFEMWESHLDFQSVVEHAWHSNELGSPLFRLVKKLSNVKFELKQWNKNVFGQVQHHLIHHRQLLERQQSLLHADPLNETLIGAERQARVNYRASLQAEESFLRQKSQQQWLELGDRNSKFFYASIKARSSRNTISCLRALDGSLYTHPDEIKESIVSYYSRLLNRDTGTPMKFPSAVTQSQNAKLIDTITSEEVKTSSLQPEVTQFPWLGWLPCALFQRFWPLIHHDLIQAVHHFFKHGHLLKQISHSFIALVPKSASTESLDGYRPISLCNTLYKILTKIMASRLQEVLPQTVNVNQPTFIKGRSIHHNILLAHELVNYLNKGGKSRACVKIDLRKAFDSVRCQFLQEASSSSARSLKYLFEDFYFVSGLQLNTSKSQVFTNCSNLDINRYLGIPQHHLPAVWAYEDSKTGTPVLKV